MLVTGGGSGIGGAYAKEFHQRGSRVLIAGRNKKTLDEVAAENPGMRTIVADVATEQGVWALAGRLASEAPGLNAVFHVAGIMQSEDFLADPVGTRTAEATIATNLLGPIRLTAALLPALRRQPHATIVTVSSGLATMPLAMTPTYCATKAAIHSWTQSLRYQLRNTNVDVIEIVPPYVATGLMGDRQANDPTAMPLDEFIAESMALFGRHPTPPEVLVQRVLPQRYAEKEGPEKYAAFFTQFNDRVVAQRT